MSASQYDEFDRRMRRISRRHTQLSRGFVTSINEDGLVVAKPKRPMRRGALRGLILIAFVMMGFKAFLYAQLGPQAYAARVDALAEGSAFERGGAWVMTADPVTVTLARYIAAAL